jgi:hypothetical protein
MVEVGVLEVAIEPLNSLEDEYPAAEEEASAEEDDEVARIETEVTHLRGNN